MDMNKQWFADQVRTHEKSLYAMALSFMKNEADANDCVQDSVLKAYRKLGSLKDPEKFKSWALGIVINTCKDELRRRNRRELPTGLTEEEPVPEAAVSYETKTALFEAVMNVPEPYRTVLVLFYYEDMPVSDISDTTGDKPATVRKQLERARKLLKAELEREDFYYDV